jgi:hypothetical protein
MKFGELHLSLVIRYSDGSFYPPKLPPILRSSSDIPSHLPHFWGSLHFSYPPIRRPVPIFLPIFLISGVPSTPHILRSDDLTSDIPSYTPILFLQDSLLFSNSEVLSAPPILQNPPYPPILQPPNLRYSLLSSEPLRFPSPPILRTFEVPSAPPILQTPYPPILRPPILPPILRTSEVHSYPTTSEPPQFPPIL